MCLSSRFATWLVLATVVITVGTFGSPALQANHNHNQQNEACGCQPKVEQKQCCPAPVLQKPTVTAPCCPAPVVREKPCAPPPPSCCPVDPKDVHKAEKAAEHAQHEAAYAHGNHEIDEATAKVNKRYSEWTEEYAKLNSLTGGPSEATAEIQPQPEP